MNEFTTVYVKQETAEKIRRLAETEGRKQYSLVDLAIALYEQVNAAKQQPAPSPLPSTQQ